MGIGSAAEWFNHRNELYKQLEECGLPSLIGDTAQLGWARASVFWVDIQNNPAEYGKPGTYCRPDFITTAQVQEYFNSVGSRFQGPLPGPPVTVSEVVALFLRQRLEALKQASNRNKRGGEPPVLVGENLRPATIAGIASDLLEDCRFHNYPPGPHLTGLIQELLGIAQVARGLRRDFDAQETAIWILAQAGKIGDRPLARRVGVAHTTIRAWRKDEMFQKRIAAVRLTIAELMLAHALRTAEKS
jgi:hypothetical protein